MTVVELSEIQEFRQEIKEDINNLDKKFDTKFDKFSEATSKAIEKMTEAINSIQILLVRDYVEKCDLEKTEEKLVGMIENNNINRKNDIKTLNETISKNNKDVNCKIELLEKCNTIQITQIIKTILGLLLASGVGFVFAKMFGS